MKRWAPLLLLFGCGGDDGRVVDSRIGQDLVSLDSSDGAPPDTTEVDEADAHEPDPCPWVDWSEGLVGGNVGYATFDPRVADQAWAGVGGQLVRSQDDGRGFDPWYAGDGVNVRELAFPDDDLKSLLAATTRGVIVSRDGGRTFAPHALGGLDVHALLLHPALPRRVFAAVDGVGVMRSDDGGETFRAVNVGVPRMIIEALAAPSDAPDVVLAAGILQNDSRGPGTGGLILRSDDGGARWQVVSDDAVWGTRLQFCPDDPRHVIAAVRRGALVSHDAGLTWDRIAPLGVRDVLDVDFAADCGRIYVSAYREGVFRLDGDVLSGPLNGGFDIEIARFQGRLAASPGDRDVVLAATHTGLYRSHDGAMSWHLIDAAPGLAVIDLANDGTNTWLTTAGSGLWRRTEATPWQRVRALPRDFTWLAAPRGDHLVVGSADDVWIADPAGTTFALAPGLFNATDALQLDDELLVTSQVGGLMRSRDPTRSWTPSNGALEPFPTSAGTFIDARAIVRVGDRLVMGLRGAGIAISDDAGATWALTTNALAHEQVVRLVVIDTTIYALAYGKGVWRTRDAGLTWDEVNAGLDSLAVMDLVSADGVLFAAEPGAVKRLVGDRFESMAPWCLPLTNVAALSVQGPWLVAAGAGNRIVRHPLP